MSWVNNIGHHCANRAFFITKHGRIGLGLSSMIKGDKACVFKGMSWPAVLRWNGEKSAYIFVNLAYVHGIMQKGNFSTRKETRIVELQSWRLSRFASGRVSLK
jgi:hypothetical protein